MTALQVFCLLCLLVQESFDHVDRLFDTVIRAVDTEVVVLWFSPLLSGVEFVVFAVLLVHFFEEAHSLFHVHIPDIHDTLCTHLKRSADKNANVRDVIILEDRICTASHDQTVLCPGEFADQVTNIEENCVLLVQSVITVQLFELRPETFM